MEIQPIRVRETYEAALLEIEGLMNAQPGTPEGDKLDVLATLVESYEARNFHVPAPDSVEAIRFAMENAGYTQSDLAGLLGSRSRASEVLNRRRPLTVAMIWKLHIEWGIPADALIRPTGAR